MRLAPEISVVPIISVLFEHHRVQEEVERLMFTWPNLDKKSRLDEIIIVN